MARREITMIITIRKPWWTHAVFAAARALVWLGYPLDIGRFSHWLGGHFKVESKLQ
jgi:hypothetical protein